MRPTQNTDNSHLVLRYSFMQQQFRLLYYFALAGREKIAAIRESGSVAHLGTIVAQSRRKQLIELIKPVINRKE
jgi:hypothetical protein